MLPLESVGQALPKDGSFVAHHYISSSIAIHFPMQFSLTSAVLGQRIAIRDLWSTLYADTANDVLAAQKLC